MISAFMAHLPATNAMVREYNSHLSMPQFERFSPKSVTEIGTERISDAVAAVRESQGLVQHICYNFE